MSIAPFVGGRVAGIGGGPPMELVGAPTEAKPSHERNLLWTSVNVGRLRGTSDQHSTIKEYIREGHSDGQESNCLERTISTTS